MNMKNLILMLLMFSFVYLVSGQTFSFENQSFRRLSTAGLVDDDLDRWVNNASGLFRDPANLIQLQGYRLYTNLSNLVSQQESIFGGNSSNNFFLGGSLPLKNWGYLGILYNLQSDKTPLDTGLSDRYGSPIFGEGEGMESNYRDTDDNGSFDTQSTIKKNVKSWEKSHNSNALLALAKSFSRYRLGIYYEYRQLKNQIIPYDGSYSDFGNTFSSQESQTDLINGKTIAIEDSYGQGNDLINTTSHTLGFSLWQTGQNSLRFGVQGAIKLYSSLNEQTATKSLLKDSSPHLEQIDTEESFQERSIIYDKSGIGLNLGISSRKKWSEKFVTDVNVGYIRLTDQLKDDAKEYELQQQTINTTIGPGTRVLSSDDQSISDISGDFTSNMLDLFTRSIAHVNERIIFGIGLGINFYKSNLTISKDINQTDIQFFDDGDIQPDDEDDYTKTGLASAKQQDKNSFASMDLRIPVGVEFNMLNNLVIRLGAEYRYLTGEATYTNDLLQASALLERVEFGDGDFSERLLQNPFSFLKGAREYQDNISSTTYYFYGAGYNISDNLQIDLMGFSKLTDLGNWKISVIIKF